MEEKLPRFYRYMFSGFETKLPLPILVSKKVGEQKLEEIFLTSQKGKTQKVKIQESLDGKVWLTKGWDEFIVCHNICLGDFAVFEHSGRSGILCFNVMLFGGTYCEIDFHDQPKDKRRTQGNNIYSVKEEINLDEVPPSGKIQKNNSTRDKGTAKRKREPKVVSKSSANQTLQFVTTVKPYHIRRRSPYMHMPAKFCKANGVYYGAGFKRVSLKGPIAEQKVSIEVCRGCRRGKGTIYAISFQGDGPSSLKATI